jgi:hypothetical protein
MAKAMNQVPHPLFAWAFHGTTCKIEDRAELSDGPIGRGGDSSASRANERRWSAMTTTALTGHPTRRGRFGRFTLHFFEMCAPMCVGFAIGDLIYFWAAGKFGYSNPFKDLPGLSVVVVTFTMTAPMVAWMVYRGMPRRPIAEMAAVMPVLGAALLVVGWLSVLPRGDLALLEHGLMMPAMLVPMFFRHDLYTSKHSHHPVGARAVPGAARNAHAR